MPKRKIKGKIISTKMDKTVVIGKDILKEHPVYKKRIRKFRKFKARDEMDSKVGDIVVIEECKPFSKTVTWKVVENISQEGSKK